MGARQVFFGALGFSSADILREGLARVLQGADPPVIELIGGCVHEDRAMVFEFDMSMPSSLWFAMTGVLHELAAIATAGHVAMLYQGDGHEFEVAMAGGGPRLSLPTPRPSRWLPLRPGMPVHVDLTREGETSALEFEVVARHDGSAALDMRDWLGLFGRLVGDGERLYYEFEPADGTGPGELFLWAEPARAGSAAVVAHPHKELISWIEVGGVGSIEVGGTHHASAVEVVVHELDARMEAAPYFHKEWRTTASSSRSLWLVPDVGLVAIRT